MNDEFSLCAYPKYDRNWDKVYICCADTQVDVNPVSVSSIANCSHIH